MVAVARSPAAAAAPGAQLLALLLAFTATGVAVAEWTVCDTANCGKGRCSEGPGPIPLITTSYNCTCDPGWSQPRLFGLPPLSFAPCVIPDCHFDTACFNFSFVPKGIPLTDPCVAINCGPGECKRGAGLSYSCECQPGYVNLLNLTALPCVKNCAFGMDCSRLGITPPPPPPPLPPSTAPPPPGSGSPWRRLLQLMLLLSLPMVQLV